MASAELFNLTQPNQKQFSDNNTMELSLTELKLFEGLESSLNGIGGGGGGGTAGESGHDGGDSSNSSSCSSSIIVGTAVAAVADAGNGDLNGIAMMSGSEDGSNPACSSPSAEAADAALAAEVVASALSNEAFDAIVAMTSVASNDCGDETAAAMLCPTTASTTAAMAMMMMATTTTMMTTTSAAAKSSQSPSDEDAMAIAATLSTTTAALLSDESGLEMDASCAKGDESNSASSSLVSPLPSMRLLNGIGGNGGCGSGSVNSSTNGSTVIMAGGRGSLLDSSDSSRSGSIGLGSSLTSGGSGVGGLASVGNGCGGGGGIGGDLMDGALEDSRSLGDDAEQECKICKSALEMPRVLSCLHVVCEGCLETLLLDETGETNNCSIACPVCKQMTTIDARGAAGLHLDYTVTNTVDLHSVDPLALACTSCKSKEQAMSRCNDCANFLCASCDNAHKYMRCFENHTVVLLSALRGSTETVVIHKPLFCAVHPSELLKFYCSSCQQVACNDCLVAGHKGADHRCDLIADAEPRVRADLEDLVQSARAQVAYCDSAAGTLSNSLTELQQQHDSARDRIEATYERCAAVLERCRDGALRELQRLHAERELHIMDAMHGVEQSVERIETTCRFARKVLADGNGVELLSLQQLISRQVHQVMQGTPRVERSMELQFEGKVERFELLAQDAFGKFRTEAMGGGGGGGGATAVDEVVAETDATITENASICGGAAVDPKESTPPPTLPGMLPMLAKSGGILGGGALGTGLGGGTGSAQSTMNGSHTASSPISMPTSMQSSFEGEMLANSFLMSNGSNGATGVLSPDVGQQQQHMQNHQLLQQQQQQQQLQHVSSVDMLKREHLAQQQQQQQQLVCNPLLSVSAVSAHSPLGNGSTLANVLANVGAGPVGVNPLTSGGLNGIGPVGNALVNGLNNSGVNPAGAALSNMAGLSSIAEYNLHRLANLVESNGGTAVDQHHHQQQQQQHQQHQHQQQHQQQQQQQHHHHNHHHHNLGDDNTVATLGVNNANNGGIGGAGNTFTLTDLINGDQRAFSQNLHALAKLNMNGGVGVGVGPLSGNVLQQQQQQRGSASPGVVGLTDNASLLSDFIGMPGNTSPIGTIASSIGDGDMGGGSGSAAGTLSSLTAAMNLAGRTKATPMQIRCKFGSLGASKAQFNSPHGFCLGVEEEIIVADTNNHRIQVFEKIGTFKFQFGVPGKEEGQLWYPRKVAVMRTSGKFVVCDRGNERSRMQIFTKNGHFIKKIAIRYIDIVAGLAVTNQGHIVAVDSVSPTVFIISDDGNLVHWFDCSDYMREPSDIAISGTDFYVCDFKGHNVAVFSENGTFLHRIGDEKITCFPNGIDISDAGDILIGDSHGNRFHVACFSRDGVLQSEFECPYVKVSRCCGLKITSEGYVVTLAKNNHHVLVLNTLYIQ